MLGTREPFFLEAGHDKFRNTKQGEHNSRVFQEKAVYMSVAHSITLATTPPREFRDVIAREMGAHLSNLAALIGVCEALLNRSQDTSAAQANEAEAAILSKFCMHPDPSKGFLLPMCALRAKLNPLKTLQ